MATLHIEHAITDFATWKVAFDRFAGRRAEAGVTGHQLQQPQDEPAYIVVRLDFASIEQALAFRQFLETRVWSVPENSPGLAGTPRARILVDAPEH